MSYDLIKNYYNHLQMSNTKYKNINTYQYQVLTVLELLPEYICVGVGAYFSCRFRMHIDF